MLAIPHRRTRVALACLAGATLGCGDAGPSGPEPQVRADGALKAAQPYVVVLASEADPHRVLSAHSARPERIYGGALTGFAAQLTDSMRYELIEDPRVRRVEPDHPVRTATEEQNLPDWGLDRIDQRGSLLDGIWSYDYEGVGTTIYVVDTGVRRSHRDLEGRARTGFDLFGGAGADCNGHGTHVAGLVGGAEFGVAKSTEIVSVRVLDCDGNGRVSGVIAGIEWVLAAHGSGPGVVNLSFGTAPSAALDGAVQRLLDAGLLVVTSAGNEGRDACDASPARVEGALTVAATDRNDTRPGFSNFGPCVDVFAPGVDLRSAHHRSDADQAVFSGTSAAAALATGVALMTAERHPGIDPANLHREIWTLSTRDVVRHSASTNSHLLFAPQDPDRADPPPPPPPEPIPPSPPEGTTVEADARRVALRVDWQGLDGSADQVEVAWRPEGGEWDSERFRARGRSVLVDHLRSETEYEVRVRSRRSEHGSWTVSSWTEPIEATTCTRRGRSALCDTGAKGSANGN